MNVIDQAVKIIMNSKTAKDVQLSVCMCVLAAQLIISGVMELSVYQCPPYEIAKNIKTRPLFLKQLLTKDAINAINAPQTTAAPVTQTEPPPSPIISIGLSVGETSQPPAPASNPLISIGLSAGKK